MSHELFLLLSKANFIAFECEEPSNIRLKSKFLFLIIHLQFQNF